MGRLYVMMRSVTRGGQVYFFRTSLFDFWIKSQCLIWQDASTDSLSAYFLFNQQVTDNFSLWTASQRLRLCLFAFTQSCASQKQHRNSAATIESLEMKWNQKFMLWTSAALQLEPLANWGCCSPPQHPYFQRSWCETSLCTAGLLFWRVTCCNLPYVNKTTALTNYGLLTYVSLYKQVHHFTNRVRDTSAQSAEDSDYGGQTRTGTRGMNHR